MAWIVAHSLAVGPVCQGVSVTVVTPGDVDSEPTCFTETLIEANVLTVLPLLLRAVKLLGIDTVMQPKDNRGRAWARIVRDLPMDQLDAMTTLAPLAEVPKHAGEILKGLVRGRLVIDVNA